jgi:anti-sigma regulatory factor (Ser/Thr protein kinase)
MRGRGTTTGVEVRADLDSGALVLCLHPDHTEEQVRAAVDASAGQHPGAVVLDLGPMPGRWAALLRGLARLCARQAVPLLVAPVLAVPAPTPVRSLVTPLPLRHHPSVAEALASLPSALVPSSQRRRVHLAADPAAAGRGRTVAADTLTGWGLDELRFPVELITSELVSNAVRHAGTPADLLLRLGPDGVRVAVHDGDPTAPTSPPASVDVGQEGGRGLLLVQATAHRWGVLTGSHDKIVWADVRPAPSSRGGLWSGHGRSARGDR